MKTEIKHNNKLVINSFNKHRINNLLYYLNFYNNKKLRLFKNSA